MMVDKLVGSMVEEMARAMEAASENEVPYWNGILLRKLAQACAAIAQKRVNELEAALTRIDQNFGHCDRCGTPCEGYTDGCCERPSWAPDDPVAVANEALYPAALPTMLKGNGDG